MALWDKRRLWNKVADFHKSYSTLTNKCWALLATLACGRGETCCRYMMTCTQATDMSGCTRGRCRSGPEFIRGTVWWQLERCVTTTWFYSLSNKITHIILRVLRLWRINHDALWLPLLGAQINNYSHKIYHVNH